MATLRFMCLLLVLIVAACASPPKPSTAPPSASTPLAARADAYFTQGRLLDALPLYEELSAQEPRNALYAGRLAFCLVGEFETLPTGKERAALVARARAEAERALKLGDKSNLTLAVLENTRNPLMVENRRNARLQAAEELFVNGDMDGALKAYKEIAAEDPRSYAANLFAGDVYFRKHDYKQAGEWFQKAIAIDPNIETAHRYWGDALGAAGDQEAALQKFIDAVVADPNSHGSWIGLKQWADRNSATLSPPHITLPKAPDVTGKTITIDPGIMDKPDSGAAWLIYSLIRSQWRTETFKKEFPDEKEYRHSLAEEIAAMRAALLVLDKKPTDDPNLAALSQLNDEGMLEAYVLMSASDEGIARDYPEYRNANRGVLRNYLLKHVVKRDSTAQ